MQPFSVVSLRRCLQHSKTDNDLLRLHCPQEYVELHQRYLVRGEDVLNEWHMETIRRRTNSAALHGPYIDPPETQKVREGQITSCCLDVAAPLLSELLLGIQWDCAGQVTRPGGS